MGQGGSARGWCDAAGGRYRVGGDAGRGAGAGGTVPSTASGARSPVSLH